MSPNIVRSVAAIFSGKAGVLLLTIATTPVLTRHLGSDGYGDFSFLLSVIQIILVIVMMGSFDGIRKYIAEERSLDGWEESVYGFYVQVALVTTLLAVIVILAFTNSDFVVSTLGSDFVFYFYIIALMIPIRVLFRTFRSVLLGFGLETYSEPLRIIDRMIFALSVVVLFYAGWGVGAVLIGRTISYTVVTVIAGSIVVRRLDLSTVIMSHSSDLPRTQLLTYSLSTMSITLLMISLYHFDVLLLRIVVGSAETGYYRAALVVAEFLWFAPIAIQMALLHSTSPLWVEKRYDQLTRIGTRATRYTLLFTLLLALGIAGLARPFVVMYFGPRFEASVQPLLLLLPGVLGFTAVRPVLAISQGQDNLRLLIFATAAAALLNVVLNVTLIPLYGMNGAAIATSTSYGSMFVLHVWCARLLGFDPLDDLRIGRIALTASLAGIPIIGLPLIISSDTLSLLFVPVVGFVVYSWLSFKTGSVDVREVRQLLSSGPVSLEELFERLPDKLSTVLKETVHK